MFIFIPAWLITILTVHLIGVFATFLLLTLLAGFCGFEEYFVLCNLWPFVFPTMIIGIITGLPDYIRSLLK